jgi:hypothetical protein
MGLFNGPPVTDAQRDLVAMTDARTREWYLEAEIAMLNMRIVELEAALKPFAYYAEQIPDDVSDTASASGTVGDLRRAREVLGS